MLNYSPLYFC